MMPWVQVDRWHSSNGHWLMSKAFNVSHPYGLHRCTFSGKEIASDVCHGYFPTFEAANARYEELAAAELIELEAA